MVPCLIFEDDHLLVLNKPAGLNTHAPAPFAGEGLYDWLRHREPRWATLAIIHRLDKETSGVIVFSKNVAANRSLTHQFTARTVRKKYLFLTDRRGSQQEFTVKSGLARAGDKYVTRPMAIGTPRAETRFRLLPDSPLCVATSLDSKDGCSLSLGERAGVRAMPASFKLWEAEPRTGRTHQIRVHAAEQGLPILGDVLYGGTPASRVFLHAAELVLKHPLTGETVSFRADFDFASDPRKQLRAALMDPAATDSFRLIHGASDAWPGWYVDKLGEFVLAASERSLGTVSSGEPDKTRLRVFAGAGTSSSHPLARGLYHKVLMRQIGPSAKTIAPALIFGESAPGPFIIRENGLRFEISFAEGYSAGLFLDQRDNRRRVITSHVGAGFSLFGNSGRRSEVLNAFAYTCGFSVCAARAGARVTSLDLSKKYLEWGKRNFALNHLAAAGHDFVYGDVFDWLPRLKKKGRGFDLVLLDPPTFSNSKDFGVFRAEKDYGRLLASALPLVNPSGVVFCSSNAANLAPETFLSIIEKAVRISKRKVIKQRYFPQPPDFPISRSEPAYLKTVWLQLD